MDPSKSPPSVEAKKLCQGEVRLPRVLGEPILCCGARVCQGREARCPACGCRWRAGGDA